MYRWRFTEEQLQEAIAKMVVPNGTSKPVGDVILAFLRSDHMRLYRFEIKEAKTKVVINPAEWPFPK